MNNLSKLYPVGKPILLAIDRHIKVHTMSIKQGSYSGSNKRVLKIEENHWSSNLTMTIF